MKSTTEKIALVIAIIWISLIISAVVGGVFLFKNFVFKTKESITSEEFISKMEENHFNVTDVTKQLEGEDVEVKEGYVARKDNCQVEFYTFKNEDDADTFYKTTKVKLDSDTASTRIQFSGRNYASFNIETNGKFKFLERINKTVVYVNVDNTYKNDIKDVLRDLGY